MSLTWALCVMLLVAVTWTKTITITADCSGDTCPDSYTMNSVYTDPTISCEVGDVLVFKVNAVGHPLWIKTQRVTGTDSAWPGVINNGQEVGTVQFTCDETAARDSPIYYQCELHAKQGGTICVGEKCGAQICPDTTCWGDAGSAATPSAVGNYLTVVKEDFVALVNALPGISNFQLTSAGFSSGAATVSFEYTSPVTYQLAANAIQSIMAEGTGKSTEWFTVTAASEASPVSAVITIADPGDEPGAAQVAFASSFLLSILLVIFHLP